MISASKLYVIASRLLQYQYSKRGDILEKPSRRREGRKEVESTVTSTSDVHPTSFLNLTFVLPTKLSSFSKLFQRRSRSVLTVHPDNRSLLLLLEFKQKGTELRSVLARCRTQSLDWTFSLGTAADS